MDLTQYQHLFEEEEKLGEAKVNTIRLVSLLVFYLNELINYYVLSVVDSSFHWKITMVVGLWITYAFTNWFLVNRRNFYHTLTKYISAFIDVAFLSWVLLLGGRPPKPPGGHILFNHCP